MKIAIIGAGYTGMAAAFELSKIPGVDIEIIEQAGRVGGMAAGFKAKGWQWALEDHYHHVFDTDQDFRRFVADLGLSSQVFYKKTKSGTLYHGKIHRLDSAVTLLQFQEISLWARLRTGAVLAFLKLVPNGVFLERYTAAEFLAKTMGKQAWQVIWRPLFVSKFGQKYDQINMAWFWARVNPRGQYLGYVKGGFQSLADKVAKKLQKRGVKICLEQRLEKLEKTSHGFTLTIRDLQRPTSQPMQKTYDQILVTLPSTVLRKLLPTLPDAHSPRLAGLAAMTLLLRLKKSLLTDGTYWLNINEKAWPFVAVVEHDNLVDKKHYGGECLVYLGRYLPADAADYQKNAQQLLQDYRPYLQKIQPDFEQSLIEVSVAKNDFAQPISSRNFSQVLPKFETGWSDFYWASLQHVYPFDRGINHAIRIGREVAGQMVASFSGKKSRNLLQ